MRPSRHGGGTRRLRRPLMVLLLVVMVLIMTYLHTRMMSLFDVQSATVPLSRRRFRRTDGESGSLGRLVGKQNKRDSTHPGHAAASTTTTTSTTTPSVDPLFQPPPPLAKDPNAKVYVSTSYKPRGPRRRPATASTRAPRSPFDNDRSTVESDEEAAREAQDRARADAQLPVTHTTSDASVDFLTALDTFEDNLLLRDVGGSPDQPSHSFVDIEADTGRGVALPYDPNFVEEEANWRACDPRNVSFSRERDVRCQSYLSNLNNMRFIKAMPSRLLQGRTIKMKIYYAHNNIQAIVKLAQRKFVYEAASEFFAYAFDRTLRFNRVPTTAYTNIPLDYLRAATAYSPLLSQWFHRFVVLYTHTNEKLTSCTYFAPPDAPHGTLENRCSDASVQLWMKDVHPALDTFLGLAYEYTESFARKYYMPGHELWEGTKKSRLRAVGELLDRFIFDFLIGNTDRGMNDHNNFVYGGCSAKTECAVAPAQERVMSLAKYAYLDHGSSLYSHKEPEGNPFFGQVDRIPICRFRRSTYTHLLPWRSRTYSHYPLISEVESFTPAALYKVTEASVVRRVQTRLDKILRVMESCLEKYPDTVVFSMPEYEDVRIYEEDATLDALGIDFDSPEADQVGAKEGEASHGSREIERKAAGTTRSSDQGTSVGEESYEEEDDTSVDDVDSDEYEEEEEEEDNSSAQIVSDSGEDADGGV